MGHSSQPTPTLLVILDGWGHAEPSPHNAISVARTPVWDALMRDCPHSLLACSGEAVGLPEGQMGNSEVGHMHMGAGRVVYQNLTRINRAFLDSSVEVSMLREKLRDAAREDVRVSPDGPGIPGWRAQP